MLDQLARHEVLQRLPGDLVVLANPPLVGAKQLGKQACVDQIDLWRSAIGQLVAIQMDNLMGAIG